MPPKAKLQVQVEARVGQLEGDEDAGCEGDRAPEEGGDTEKPDYRVVVSNGCGATGPGAAHCEVACGHLSLFPTLSRQDEDPGCTGPCRSGLGPAGPGAALI